RTVRPRTRRPPSPARRVSGLEAVVEDLERDRPELGAGAVVGAEEDEVERRRQLVDPARARTGRDVPQAMRPRAGAVGDPGRAAAAGAAGAEVEPAASDRELRRHGRGRAGVEIGDAQRAGGGAVAAPELTASVDVATA